MAEFDKTYWEHHWNPTTSNGVRKLPAHPYLATETAHLRPGTALDAGCGTGAEAIWLAAQGWQGHSRRHLPHRTDNRTSPRSRDRKSTRLNSSHVANSYAVF